MRDVLKAGVETDSFDAEIKRLYWDEEEYCKQIVKSRRTARRMEQERTGPPRTVIGRRVLYRKQAVIDWLASLEQARAGRLNKARRTRVAG